MLKLNIVSTQLQLTHTFEINMTGNFQLMQYTPWFFWKNFYFTWKIDDLERNLASTN